MSTDHALAPLSHTSAMLALITRWAEHGWLRDIDAAFAEFLVREHSGLTGMDVADGELPVREVPRTPPLLVLAAALASHQLGHGHACLDLRRTLEDPSASLSLPPPDREADTDETPPLPGEVLLGVTVADWRAILIAHPDLVGQGPGNTPLVCVGERVYLRRYWAYEQTVRCGIDARLADVLVLPAEQRVREVLEALFPRAAATPVPDWQKLACAVAARSAFAIVTGGPGTGKTTTVVRLLAALQALVLAGGAERPPLRIRLTAPTGKAAARLSESIAGAVQALELGGLGADAQAIRAAIPREVTTLHRLLGSRPDTRHFRHHAGNPLPVDLVVVDEASMVDLEMMASLLAALPPKARLVLLGDKDQLASVEAGSVLGELCRRAGKGYYSEDPARWLHAVTGEQVPPELVRAAGTALDQAVAMLRHSHRFPPESGIGQLAAAVNEAKPGKVRSVLSDKAHADLASLALETDGEAALRRLVIDGAAPADSGTGQAPAGYRRYLQMLRSSRPQDDAAPDDFEAWGYQVLQAHGQFQLLCALRSGPWGVTGLNWRVATWLANEGLIDSSDGWYAGRPVLVTRNDYGLGLMNGDIGVTLDLPGPQGQRVLRVAFLAGDGSQRVRWVQPSRLQDLIETVFAMTVHKSQGSEFTHAALVLPPRSNPILTGELVYTGITRARKRFTLVETGEPSVLERSVQRRVRRYGGLMASADASPGTTVA